MADEQGTVSEGVIRKIQKLFELGSRSHGNEEEAAAAMAKAQELLAQYNLDMAVVRDSQVAGGVQPDVVKREERKINRSAQYDWQKELWKALSDCNFCWHFVQTFEEKAGRNRAGEQKYVRVKRHTILGAVENVTMVNLMGEYLCDTIERLLPWTENSQRLSREAISWRAGCAHRLIERLYKQLWERRRAMRAERQAATAGATTTTAIVLRDVESTEYAANYDFMFGEGAYAKMLENQRKADELAKAKPAEVAKPETAEERRKREAQEAKWAKQSARDAQRRRHKYDSHSFSQGYSKGDDISLNNQVGAGNPGNRLPN